MMPAQHPAKRQRGIAAVTALLVVAIATVLAAELAWDLHVDIQRSESMLLRNQAIQFALGAEMMAADGLLKDYESDAEDDEFCDYPGEGWDEEITLPFECGTVRGKITDLQGRFNLNNLVTNGTKDQPMVDFLTRLLEQLELDRDLAMKILDWIDPDQTEELGGAEDGAYTLQTPPYRAANTWFTTTTELMAVDGFIDFQAQNSDKDIFRTLERLLAMSEDSGTRDAAALRANRPYCKLWSTNDADGTFYGDAKDVINENFVKDYLAVHTNFFQLKVLVTLGTTQLTMYSLLYRDANGLVTTRLRYFDTK